MALRRLLSIACLGFVALLLSGCAEEEPSLGEVRKFDAYPVYYAGEEIAGFPLRAVYGDAQASDPRSGAWVFIYGRCIDPPAEGGCPPPLQIHNHSACARWASAFDGSLELYDLRGAKARDGGLTEGQVEIFTGRTSLKIYSPEPYVLRAALRELRLVNAAKPPSRLPAPAPGSLTGKLPCQDRPS